MLPPPSFASWFKVAAVVLLGALLLWLAAVVFFAGHTGIAIGVGLLAFATVYIYLSKKAYSWRYLLPGLVGFGLFVIYPLIYTVYIGFTNYSSLNLLTYDRVIHYFKTETYLASDTKYGFTLHRESTEGRFALVLTDRADPELKYVAREVTVDTAAPAEGAAPMVAAAIAVATRETLPTTPALALREIVALRNGLRGLSFTLPDGLVLNNTGLREFAPRLPLWRHDPATDRFTHATTGEIIAPNPQQGRWQVVESPDASRVGSFIGPGYRVLVGFDNYIKVLGDKGMQEPLLKILLWTIIFAVGSVFCSLCVGMLLAVILEWKALEGRKIYRTLLILPYAVPAFISILIFKGLFNQNFGEVNNLIFEPLFGIKPEWFADPVLAKTMILIVNTWLGFPYMMIVCTGILQSVPDSIYEASAIDGSNPVVDFFQLTLPLIFKPLFPLLVASFAFNFNNFVLIALLTGGGPDMVASTLTAGETDILVSYTFRIAFRDTAQNFGFASAIATLIFLFVAAVSWWNLKNTEKAS